MWYTALMTLVYGPDNAFFTIKIQDVQYTDGFALVTGGLQAIDGDLDAAAATVLQAYKDCWGDHTWATSIISECTVINETDIGVASEPEAGTAPGVSVASVNSALLLHKTSGIRGRRGRGRTFLPSVLTEGVVFGDGSLDPGFLSTMQGAADQWRSMTIPGGRPHAIAQSEARPRKDGSPGSPPIIPWPGVSTITVDTKIATQRRRLRR